MNIMRSILFLTIILSALSFPLFASEDVHIETIPEKVIAARAEDFVLTTTVSWPGQGTEGLSIAAITPPESELALLQHATQSSSSALIGSVTMAQKTFNYRYKAKEIGVDTFTPFVIELKSGDAVTVLKKGNEVEIEVVGYFKRYFIICLGIVALGVIILSFVVGVKASRETKAVKEASRTKEASAAALRGVEERALSELEAARSSLIAGNKVSYLTKVRDVVIHYGETKGLSDEEWTKNIEGLTAMLNAITYAGKVVSEDERRAVVRKFEIVLKKNVQEKED